MALNQSTSGQQKKIIGGGRGAGPGPEIMAADSLDNEKVVDLNGESVGKITDIMLDVVNGRIAYAVLSVGGLFGLGDKLFAIPWGALTLDTDRKCFILNANADRLKDAPGFDKDHWPTMADPSWASTVHQYYNVPQYWH